MAVSCEEHDVTDLTARLADTLGLTALMTWCHSRGPYSRVLTAHEGQAWRDQADAAIGELVDALAVYKKDDLDAKPLAEAVVRLEAENEWLRSLLPSLLPQTGQHRAVTDSAAPESGPETEPERP